MPGQLVDANRRPEQPDSSKVKITNSSGPKKPHLFTFKSYLPVRYCESPVPSPVKESGHAHQH
jgi:hypothetical protein